MTARKYAAINIDGVLLTDTFSTVIYDFIVEHGGTYDEDTERAILSQPQSVGGAGMARAARQNWSPTEAIAKYFERRSEYTALFPPEVSPGARELLHRLREYGYSLISYGGLSKDHFDAEVGDLAQLFDDPVYVCTNSIRPGVREICDNVLGIRYEDLLVIDDVARVGIECRRLRSPFIGHPSVHPNNHQRKIMHDNGLLVVDRLRDIDAAKIEEARDRAYLP